MSATARNRIRVESSSPTASDAKVFYIPPEGDEVEISNCITGVDLHLRVGQATRAKLHTIIVGGEARAEVEEVVVRLAYPSRWSQFRYRIRRWWHKR